jgi:hypothetical protein
MRKDAIEPLLLRRGKPFGEIYGSLDLQRDLAQPSIPVVCEDVTSLASPLRQRPDAAVRTHQLDISTPCYGHANKRRQRRRRRNRCQRNPLPCSHPVRKGDASLCDWPLRKTATYVSFLLFSAMSMASSDSLLLHIAELHGSSVAVLYKVHGAAYACTLYSSARWSHPAISPPL